MLFLLLVGALGFEIIRGPHKMTVIKDDGTVSILATTVISPRSYAYASDGYCYGVVDPGVYSPISRISVYEGKVCPGSDWEGWVPGPDWKLIYSGVGSWNGWNMDPETKTLVVVCEESITDCLVTIGFRTRKE